MDLHYFIFGLCVVDADGKIDHLIPVCSDVACDGSHIYVYAKGKVSFWLVAYAL